MEKILAQILNIEVDHILNWHYKATVNGEPGYFVRYNNKFQFQKIVPLHQVLAAFNNGHTATESVNQKATGLSLNRA